MKATGLILLGSCIKLILIHFIFFNKEKSRSHLPKLTAVAVIRRAVLLDSGVPVDRLSAES
jgi:hypothetical protein